MIEAPLALDMFNFGRQLQSAAHAAKACAAPLSGKAPPRYPDTETKFDELKSRIAKVIAYVEGFATEARLAAALGASPSRRAVSRMFFK